MKNKIIVFLFSLSMILNVMGSEKKLSLFQNKKVNNYGTLTNIPLDQPIKSSRGLSLEYELLVDRIARDTSCNGPEISRLDFDVLREMEDKHKNHIVGRKVNVFSGDENFRRKINSRFYEAFPVCCVSSTGVGALATGVACLEGLKAVFVLKPLLCLGLIPAGSCLICTGALCCEKGYTCYHSERAILECENCTK